MELRPDGRSNQAVSAAYTARGIVTRMGRDARDPAFRILIGRLGEH